MAWVFSLILHNMERRIRKLIRVSAITVGALLLTGFVVVAFVINYVFTPDKLTPIVLNVANRSLDADLKVESVELTFFWLSGNFWLVSFKISYLCLPLFYETRTTPSCHPSGCAYRQL